MENMENLRQLYLDGTAIEELPSSIEHLQGLQVLSLYRCESLVSLPASVCNLRSLKTLDVGMCSKLQQLPENLGGLQSLEDPYAAFLDSISFQLLSLSGLCSLRRLVLQKTDVMQGAIPSDICCLYSLEVLNLSNCNLTEGGIPSEIYNLSSLKELSLGGNHFSSIPAGINKLSQLRVLNLSHCQLLLQIPALPSSLRLLDVHGCTLLETLSSPSSLLPSCLFKCFESTIQDSECGINNRIFSYDHGVCYNRVLQIFISSSGKPGWTRYQNEESMVSIELPWNWYRNNDLLGFALCSVHVPPDKESEDGHPNYDYNWCLECELTIGGGHQFKPVRHFPFQCLCDCHIDDVSSQVLVTYYPRIRIPSKYASNKSLKAAFQGYFKGEPVKVENCGIYLIYANEQEPSRL